MKKRLSVHLDPWVYNQIKAVAERQERPISWVVERLWKIAGPQLQQYPTPDEIDHGLAVSGEIDLTGFEDGQE